MCSVGPEAETGGVTGVGALLGSASRSESPVRSITSFTILSWAAFSASRIASSPDAHAFSSRALLSAAYNYHE